MSFRDQYADRKQHQSLFYRNRIAILDSLPVNDKSIVFIGDSETQSFAVAELFNNVRCLNRGVGSDKSENISKRLSFIIKGKPAKIFLQAGTNDLLQKVPPATFKANMERIVNAIRIGTVGTQLYIQNILPSSRIDATQLKAFNTILKSLATKNSLTYIDLYLNFNDNGTLKAAYDFGDGLHLSYQGYKKWTAILKPYIN